MKPTDLFNAIENIPDEYIDAAKPSSVKRHGESRSVVQKSVRDAEAVSSKTNSLSDARHTHSRKDSIRMSTKQPVLQRIATAFAAAAACAVFAGGGLFIVQQARQNQQDSRNSSVEAAMNFLGGSGSIRTTDDMFLMYDDQKLYFLNALYTAARSGSEVESLQMREHLNDILYDGGQFFRAESTKLYRIDMQGNHADEKPFYTISEDGIQNPMFHIIRKLSDSAYYLCYSYSFTDDEETGMKSGSRSIIYQPATGQQDEIPNGSTASAQTVGDNGIIYSIPEPRMVTDGKDIIFAEFDGSMYRVTLDPVKIEQYEPVPKAGSYTHDWMIADGSVYFMTGIGDSADTDEDDAPYSYGRIDLAAHTYTEILPEADFRRFYPYEGSIFALTENNTKLVCADPDWKNTETVCDFRSDMTEAFTNALNETCGGDLTNAYITAVDENYILVCFVYGDPGKSCAVIDRKTGSVRFFRSPETEEYTPENTAEQNLLGGTGALHSAGRGQLLYDNDYVYPEFGCFRGDRNSAEQITDASLFNAAGNVFVSDGKNLYVQKDFSLFPLDSSGKAAEQPFFTVSDADIRTFREQSGGTAYLLNMTVDRLTDQYYHVFVQLADTQTAQEIGKSRMYGYLYNAETKDCRTIPGYESGSAPFSTYRCGDSFYCAPYDVETLYRFDLDSYTFEEVPAPDPYIIWNGCILPKDDAIYYLTTGKYNSFYEPYYCKYDLKTKRSEIISTDPGFDHFFPFEGKIYAANSKGTQIFCADADLKNRIVLMDFERDVPDTLKQSAQKAVNGAGAPITLIARVDCADENYVCAHLADGTDFLMNRQTGTVTFYPYPDPEAEPQNNTQTEPDTDENPAQENVFGGWGRLCPVDWDVRGAVALYRDDNNYYFFNNDGKWYRCPLAGGQKEQLPARIAGAQAPQDAFISDGERVYTKDMIVISEGNAGNAFDVTAIRTYLEELNDDETDNGYYYDCANIWHIRNRYFLNITGTNAENNLISIEVWTDENGKIISHEKAQGGISRYFCSGSGNQMCAVRDGFLDIIDCPGDEPDDKPDPLAYGKIRDLYLDMNGSYFLTDNLDLYTFDHHGEKALITEVPFDEPLLMTAPDHRFFYVNTERLNFSLREWNENGEDEEIYAPENSNSQELWICGYEQTGNGSYNIVLKRTYDQNQTGFVFVDPTTGQTVKQIL